MTFASAAFAGNFFATGHDQDYHCTNGGEDGTPSADECAYYKLTTTFVRGGSTLPLLILDRDSTSDGAAGSSGDATSPLEAVTSLNLAYSDDASTSPTASSPPYVVEDPQGLQPTIINGTPPSGITTSSKWATTPLVNSSGSPLWSAIIVASDTNCGGCDLNNDDGTHVDSDDINARTSAIDTFFNDGGGLLYLAGATDAYDANGVSGDDVYYASVPVPVGGQPVSPPFTVTAAGAALGITSDMANCCATHNSFTLPSSSSPLKAAETDSAGLAESLFIQGGSVCGSSFCASKPVLTGAPVLSGSTKPGGTLTCSTGTWTGNPTSYTYAWYRNGTLLAGVTGSTYVVKAIDEGTTFKCVVTASNAGGSASGTSNSLFIPIPHVPGCPAATGKMTGSRIGQLKLGITRKKARFVYRRHHERGRKYEDFFCLTPIGVRAGYPSPKLLGTLSTGEAKRIKDRVVWASTSNPYYSLGGVRAGESIRTASRKLGTGRPFHIGHNYWYLARKHGYTAVLKVRHGVVEELGIANSALTHTRAEQGVLMHSFY